MEPVNLFKFNERDINVASWPRLGFFDFFQRGTKGNTGKNGLTLIKILEVVKQSLTH